jgi:hypothetical protein
MADYYQLIARVIAGLHEDTAEARRVVYETARSRLVGDIRAADPSISESELTRERVALEQAIRDVEAERLTLWARKSVSTRSSRR